MYLFTPWAMILVIFAIGLAVFAWRARAARRALTRKLEQDRNRSVGHT